MSPLIPQDPDALKRHLAREVAALRETARHGAGVRLEDVPAPAGAAPADAAGERCACGSRGPGHGCCGEGDGSDPWACVGATLPAIPLSAALFAPVRDEEGRTVDFTVEAGNHVRAAQWLEAPDRQVGRRLLEVQPGAAVGGLVGALDSVLESGRALKGYALDYTEQHSDGLHRTKLLYDASSCGGKVLATWRAAHNRGELLSLDAQYIASMGWGTWDLLSGEVTWSEGLSSIFRTDPARPAALAELCDMVLPEDVARFAKFLLALVDGEEPPGTEIRFSVLGEIRTLHLVGHPVIATDGLPWSVHVIARDLTSQVRSRQRLAATRSGGSPPPCARRCCRRSPPSWPRRACAWRPPTCRRRRRPPWAGTGTSAGCCRTAGSCSPSATPAATGWLPWPGWRSSGMPSRVSRTPPEPMRAS
ncbi:hypothetical protein SIN09_28840 [Streptomyces sp. F8]|uniref:hypothetical protein n=1 Tax=Streptomyces sp. F8 TaxID=1436085 RepID=UPI0029CD6CDB|nr:hypothetical protein [Streptomyces sp. F8]MDX6763304.1 hypothetical protein [Streptomyces sp. F8]